jgi:hypothetical protein
MSGVLALDLATVVGFAIDGHKRNSRGAIIPISGSFRAGPPFQDGMDHGPAFVDLRDRIVDLVTVHTPRYAIFEAPLPFAGGSNVKVHASPATVRKLFGFCAVAEEVLTRLGVQVMEANVQDVRRHFCGNARAKKPDVQQMCRVLCWPFADDNEADALALWDFARGALKLGDQSGPLFGGEAA